MHTKAIKQNKKVTKKTLVIFFVTHFFFLAFGNQFFFILTPTYLLNVFLLAQNNKAKTILF